MKIIEADETHFLHALTAPAAAGRCCARTSPSAREAMRHAKRRVAAERRRIEREQRAHDARKRAALRILEQHVADASARGVAQPGIEALLADLKAIDAARGR